MLRSLRNVALSLFVGVLFLGGFFLLTILIGSWFNPSVKPAGLPTWVLYVGAPFGLWHLWLMGPGMPGVIAAMDEADNSPTEPVLKDQK